MEALNKLVAILGDLGGAARGVATCAASLYLLKTLALPAWAVALSLADAGSAVMVANGTSLAVALGVLWLANK